MAGWLGVLDGGGSRAEVVRGFSQSREFVNDTTAPLEAWIRAQGIDDIIDGGDGPDGRDILIGGILSDQFVLSQNTGTTTVADLERWDVLDFTAFDFTDKQDVLDRLVTRAQAEGLTRFDGDPASYDDLAFLDRFQNTVVTFDGITAGGITLDMIEI